MALAFLLGRVILGIYWLETAYKHLFKSAGLIGYTQSKGIKSAGTAKLAVWGSGVLALIGGLSIILGYHPHWGIAALILFLIGVSWKIHDYWNVQDPMAKMNDRISFMKNVALIGALLMMFAITEPWVYSI